MTESSIKVKNSGRYRCDVIRAEVNVIKFVVESNLLWYTSQLIFSKTQCSNRRVFDIRPIVAKYIENEIDLRVV